MNSLSQRLVSFLERILTYRMRRKARRHVRQRAKNPIRDWIEAFLQAAFMVILINQYLLQAYQIPSGSMIRTLLLGDRIFVNKVIYGPEVLPGLAKLPGVAVPDAAEVIVFENPSYIGRGTAFTIVQRILYMVTLSLVDIDRDERGQPRAQLLIKRAVGMPGDRLRVHQGNMEIRPAGESLWMDEASFRSLRGFKYETQRLLSEDDYVAIEAGGAALSRRDLGLAEEPQDASRVQALRNLGFGDPFGLELAREGRNFSARPDDTRLRQRVQFVRLGWYVPDSRIFPLGDNRDNSRDGRYFGAVPTEDVLGRAMFIYWPFDRLRAIR